MPSARHGFDATKPRARGTHQKWIDVGFGNKAWAGSVRVHVDGLEIVREDIIDRVGVDGFLDPILRGIRGDIRGDIRQGLLGLVFEAGFRDRGIRGIGPGRLVRIIIRGARA